MTEHAHCRSDDDRCPDCPLSVTLSMWLKRYNKGLAVVIVFLAGGLTHYGYEIAMAHEINTAQDKAIASNDRDIVSLQTAISDIRDQIAKTRTEVEVARMASVSAYETLQKLERRLNDAIDRGGVGRHASVSLPARREARDPRRPVLSMDSGRRPL